jgi:hypothetical protein
MVNIIHECIIVKLFAKRIRIFPRRFLQNQPDGWEETTSWGRLRGGAQGPISKVLITGAAAATHGAEIAGPGGRRRVFELFVELVFELAPLIGEGIWLSSFRCSTGLQAIVLGAEDDFFQIMHIRL